MISLQTALGSHSIMCLGDSQTGFPPELQNQPKPITLASHSMCSELVQSALGGSQSHSGSTHTSAGGLIPVNNQQGTTFPDFVGIACQHCFVDVGKDFKILGEVGNFAPVCSACSAGQVRRESQSFQVTFGAVKEAHAKDMVVHSNAHVTRKNSSFSTALFRRRSLRYPPLSRRKS